MICFVSDLFVSILMIVKKIETNEMARINADIIVKLPLMADLYES